MGQEKNGKLIQQGRFALVAKKERTAVVVTQVVHYLLVKLQVIHGPKLDWSVLELINVESEHQEFSQESPSIWIGLKVILKNNFFYNKGFFFIIIFYTYTGNYDDLC